MSLITGPKRAYAVGETKSQNAVIKVYTVAELKRALTQVYQLPNGVGTIEIATDITITEPIKLNALSFTESKISEIIIQAVSGARIINGNKSYGTAYNYNTAGNNNIPVFDLGVTSDSVFPDCKYTFKDLTINTETSKPFGALITANSAGVGAGSSSRKINTITLNNIKAFNLWNILAVYDTTGFAGLRTVLCKNLKIDDFKYLNVDPTITQFNYNTEEFCTQDSIINNVGTLGTGTANNFNIYNKRIDFVGNIFTAISAPINIAPLLPADQRGISNTIISSFINSSDYQLGFAYVNTVIPGGGSPFNNTILPTIQHRSAFHLTALDPDQQFVTTSSRFIVNGTNKFGASVIPGFYGAPANSYYELDWKLIVNFIAADRTATATSGLATISLTNTAELKIGMGVSGTYVPAGATIVSINPGVSITISAAATGSGTTTLSFVGQINSYHFKTNIRFGNESDRLTSNFVRSYTNNTISAMEEITTISLNIVYFDAADTLELHFLDTTSTFSISGEITLTGNKFPIT